MTRTVKRMSYPDAARELAEATELLDHARTELNRATRNWEQALFNMLDALARRGTGPPVFPASDET